MRQEQLERRMLGNGGYESEDRHMQAKVPSSLKQIKGATKLGAGTLARNSTALMPLTENESNLRAQHEIQMIKKLKQDKEDDLK